LQERLDEPRALVTFGSIVGGTAWSLALIGLFGATAFAVAQRRHEASVRMALGARPSQVVRLIMRDSLRPVAVGLALGLALALTGGRLLQSSFYGISSHDPIALTAAVVLLVTTVAIAAFLPARHAARADPGGALKDM
jgi:ABC-type antimicrobial peptide transport system permease subunit